ncbi:MAG: hypothetical protein ND807_00910 [Vicinamibacterales bacterium]|nr:hypothetical protein [Vicinamibacterales bacterium]
MKSKMKSKRGGSLQSGLLFESDLRAYFDKLWNELDGIEECAVKSASICGDARLDRNDESGDVASNGPASPRRAPS